MRSAIVAFLLAFSMSSAFAQALLLFDDQTGREFVGCLNCNRYDAVAVCNKYGEYGSKYQSGSIWNKYGTFGSKYQSESPWNKYGTGLRIVDNDGNFYGNFSVGYAGRASGIPLVRAIAEAYESLDGDLDALRDAVCE